MVFPRFEKLAIVTLPTLMQPAVTRLGAKVIWVLFSFL